jgi:hypothetical protein
MVQRDKYSQGFQRGDYTLGPNPENIHASVLPEMYEKYFLERCEYFYGMYSANQSFLGFGGQFKGRSFKTMRDHARGMQNMEKYMDTIDPKKRKGRHQGKRKLNISKRPAMYLTKFRDIVRSKFDGANVEPQTMATDELARQEKQVKYNEMKFLAQAETVNWLQGIGIPVENGGFESAQDVDIYERMGGVRLGVEIMMKDALDVSKNESGWDILKPMLIEDVIDLNACAIAIEKDNSTGRLKYKYVDPARMGMRHSIYPDARDTDFKFFIETSNLATIRAESNLPEEEIRKIERLYKGKNGNPSNTSSYDSNIGTRNDYASNNTNIQGYSGITHDYSVEVMTLYFIDTQVQRFVDGVHPNGNRIFERVAIDSVLKGRDKKTKKIVDVPMHNVYKCKWIVGTSYVYDYGLDHTIVREGSDGCKKPIIPIVNFVGQEPSIIERCIGFDDDIQLATLKMRSLISKLPPGPRMIFDQTAMEDSVTINKEKYTVLEMLQEYQTEGIMVIKSRGEAGIPGIDEDHSRRQPFTFVETGIAEDMNILHNELLKGLEGIRQVTGVNPVSDGTNTQGDMLKGVMAGMQAATNNALMPHINNFVATLRRLYEVNMKKWQLLVLRGEITVDNLPVADQMFKNIKITEELHNRDMGIYISMETVEDRQILLQDLMSKKDFIGTDIYYVVYNAIRDGDVKKAQLILAKHTQDAEEKAHAKQMQLVKAQTEGNAQAAIEAEKAKQQTIILEYEQKMKFATHTHNLNKDRDQDQAKQKVEGDVIKETTKAAVSS